MLGVWVGVGVAADGDGAWADLRPERWSVPRSPRRTGVMVVVTAMATRPTAMVTAIRVTAMATVATRRLTAMVMARGTAIRLMVTDTGLARVTATDMGPATAPQATAMLITPLSDALSMPPLFASGVIGATELSTLQ